MTSPSAAGWTGFSCPQSVILVLEPSGNRSLAEPGKLWILESVWLSFIYTQTLVSLPFDLRYVLWSIYPSIIFVFLSMSLVHFVFKIFFSSLWYIVTVCSEKMSDSDFWKVFLSESTYFWPPSSVWSPCLSGLRDGSNGLGMMSILGLDILPNEGSSMWKKKSLNCLILGYLHAISSSLSPQRLILQSSYSESFWPVTYRHFFEKVGHYWNTFRYVLWFLKSDVDFNF